MIDFDNAIILQDKEGTITIKIPHQDEPQVLKKVLQKLEERGDKTEASDIEEITVCFILTKDLIAQARNSVHFKNGTQTNIYIPCNAPREMLQHGYDLLTADCEAN